MRLRFSSRHVNARAERAELSLTNPAKQSGEIAATAAAPRPRVYRRKRDAVLDAAEAAFLESGYATTSMDAIAERAGVSKKTVYSNFGSKEDLFAEVIRRRCAAVIPDPIDEAAVRDRDPEEVLLELSTEFLTNVFATSQVQLYQTVVAASRLFPKIGQVMFEGPILGSQAVFDRYLRDQARIGRLHFPNIDLAAAQLIALLKTNIHMQLLFSQPVELSPAHIAELARASVNLFLRGARVPALELAAPTEFSAARAPHQGRRAS